MDFGIFKKMGVEELKNYLRIRGLKVSGNKDVLIARAFMAHENHATCINSRGN